MVNFKHDVNWENGNLETRIEIQKMLFTEKLYYNKKNDIYLTENYNTVLMIFNQELQKKKVRQRSGNRSLSHYVLLTNRKFKK